MIAVLVCDPRTFDVKLDMNAITISTNLEKFASNLDGRGVRVLGIMDTFGLCESTRRKFAYTLK